MDEVLATTEEVNKSVAMVTSDPESLIRYAIDKGAGIETIERMMAVRDKLKAEWAKKEYDEALASFQNECPIIKKSKAGAKSAYYYAPFEDIISQTKDLIRKHGFSYRITSETKGQSIKAICRITHQAGHSETTEFEVPIDTRNTMMNEPQKFAGSRTFASRYAFCGGFGIVTMDSDTDGRTERDKPAGPSALQVADPALKPLANELWTLFKKHKVHKMLPDGVNCVQNWKAANKWLVDNNILSDDEKEAPMFDEEKFKSIIAASKAILEARP